MYELEHLPLCSGPHAELQQPCPSSKRNMYAQKTPFVVIVTNTNKVNVNLRLCTNLTGSKRDANSILIEAHPQNTLSLKLISLPLPVYYYC